MLASQTPRASVSSFRGKRGLRERAELAVVRAFGIWLFNIVARGGYHHAVRSDVAFKREWMLAAHG